MKHRDLFAWGLIILLLMCCGRLWQQERAAQEKLVELCQNSAAAARSQFEEYTASGNESAYTYGVAEFRSFMNAYLYLHDNIADAEYTWCNTVYGQLVLHPERVRAHLPKLIDALTYLAGDYTDFNGYILINELSNELRHGGS